MVKNRKLLFLVPVVAGTAALAAIHHVTRGIRHAKRSLADYFGPLAGYDRVTVYHDGKSTEFTERDPGYATVIRLLGDLPFSSAKQRYGDDEDMCDLPKLVVALECGETRAAVVFADENELRLTPPGGRWLLLSGDFSAACRALCALADSWCE